MKTFASQMESLTQIRHSFCSRMFMAPTVVLVFVMIGGLPQAALAQPACPSLPATITQCPCRIESPGQYSLSQNLMNCDGLGIAIIVLPPAVDLKDVYLNLNGHTISGRRGGSSTGIIVNGSNIHIVGSSDVHGDAGTVNDHGLSPVKRLSCGSDVHGDAGTVEGFDIGIQVSASRNIHLSRLTLTGNGAGLNLADSNDNQVSCNKISANVGGSQVINSNHNVFDSNIIDGESFGLFLGNSHDNTISSNEFSRHFSCGVCLGESERSSSNHNTIRGNIVENNPENVFGLGVGIVVRGIDNTIPSHDNTIQSNTVSGHQTGIQLVEASGNFVYGNTALRNTRADLWDFNVNPDCNGNTWTNNIFKKDRVGVPPDDQSDGGPLKGCIQ